MCVCGEGSGATQIGTGEATMGVDSQKGTVQYFLMTM